MLDLILFFSFVFMRGFKFDYIFIQHIKGILFCSDEKKGFFIKNKVEYELWFENSKLCKKNEYQVYHNKEYLEC